MRFRLTNNKSLPGNIFPFTYDEDEVLSDELRSVFSLIDRWSTHYQLNKK